VANVVVLGEVIADLALGPRGGHGSQQLTAHPGGSPANVAVGLARLEVPASFAGRLSNVGLGPWLREHLASSGVDLSLSVAAPENCTLALVGLTEQGTPSYTFYVDGTADWQWQANELPDVRRLGAAAVHAGSLAVALPPGRDLIAGWLAAVHQAGDVLVSLDLNVRPSLISDLARYRDDMRSLIDHAHLVKVSEEDVGVLYPGEDPLEVGRQWARDAPELVLVTHGPRGASAIRPGGKVLHRAAPAVTVVDTVGAGDAFTAGFLAHLFDRDSLHPGALSRLEDGEVFSTLDFANRVGAITCSRAGADPPLRSEL